MKRKSTPQRERRAAYELAERDVRAQVLDRDDSACAICGTRDSPNLQHRTPRSMGGTVHPITPAAGIVLHGSGTTGCHGAVEQEGRADGWAYDLGYLIRPQHGIGPEDIAVWYHHERAWYVLLDSGVRVLRARMPYPDETVLAVLDARMTRRPGVWTPSARPVRR